MREAVPRSTLSQKSVFVRGRDPDLSSTSPLQSPCQAQDENLLFMYSQRCFGVDPGAGGPKVGRVRFTRLDMMLTGYSSDSAHSSSASSQPPSRCRCRADVEMQPSSESLGGWGCQEAVSATGRCNSIPTPCAPQCCIATPVLAE